MAKPEILIKLEKTYNFTLKKRSKKDISNGLNTINSYEIDDLNNVIGLSIGYSEVRDISFLQSFKHLKQLNLISNFIDDFTPLKKLPELIELNLQSTNLKDLNILKSLKKIKILNVAENKIIDISLLGEFQFLEKINLSRNPISNIEVLAKLDKLTSLDLWQMNITDTSPLHNLTKLKRLSVWENKIENIEFLKNFSDIQVLDLGSNPVKNLNVINQLGTLIHLEVDNCKIKNLDFIDNLQLLTKLNLSSNKIEDISILGKLTKLENLNLNNNKIKDISSLKNLNLVHTLFLDGNKIEDLRPLESLIKKKNLLINYSDRYASTGISLKGNFITIPPPEVFIQGNETTLQYFDDANNYGIRPLNECKLILLGDGELGKTSLMKKIVGLPFSQEPTTHGINKKTWSGLKNDVGEEISVNLWDFGGQHIQHSLHQFFLREKVIYILLLNPRNDTNAMYWLEQINKLGKDSEILIVYNWKDVKDRDSHSTKNFYELRKTYPQLKEPFLLSCASGEGFESFKTELIATISKQNDMRVQYPLNWFNIKNELEQNVTVNKNYISYNEYDLICKNNSYTNSINKKNLLKQLDKIGSIVFFDKPILNDLQVLNPDWITTGAYSVITSEITTDKKGHLNYSDLLEIFRDEKYLFSNENVKLRYEEKDFLFILSLMTEYDLCVNNPFQNNEYLIPCAFEGEKPSKFNNFKSKCRQYRFKFESAFEMLIMYRFMARNISKCVAKDGYWQSGIVIKDPYSDTYALVETNQYSKIINFWIKGPSIRAFWEVLRHDIKDINSQYSLNYEEQVLYDIDNNGSGSIFLSYDEMINSLQNGVRILPYHPIHKIFNIDVLKVLENFEDSKLILKEMKRSKIIVDVRGDINNSQLQVGGVNNNQTSYLNQFNDNTDIEKLKDILEDLEDIAKDNVEWQTNFANALKEIYRLEEATDKIDEKKSTSKLMKFFNKAKNLKDIVAIGVLPAEVALKVPKMIDLAEKLFGL
jgi:internalin A